MSHKKDNVLFSKGEQMRADIGNCGWAWCVQFTMQCAARTDMNNWRCAMMHSVFWIQIWPCWFDVIVCLNPNLARIHIVVLEQGKVAAIGTPQDKFAE